MARIQNHSVVAVPAEFAFGYTADFRNAATWMFGITRLEVVGDIELGLGAVYEGSIKLGPKTLHSTTEVTVFEPGHAVGTESTAGFVNRSTWRFQALGDNRTEILADLEYELPGGLAGRALGRVIEPFVHVAVKHSDEALSRQLVRQYQVHATQA